MAHSDRPHLVTRTSSHSARDTANKLVSLIQEKGLTIFARIDHSANAERVGLNMKESELILFGNPNAGTVLMQNAPTMAIDLPQKFLIWVDNDDTVKISHQNMSHLKTLHSIKGVDELIEKISMLLENLASNAAI